MLLLVHGLSAAVLIIAGDAGAQVRPTHFGFWICIKFCCSGSSLQLARSQTLLKSSHPQTLIPTSSPGTGFREHNWAHLAQAWAGKEYTRVRRLGSTIELVEAHEPLCIAQRDISSL